MSLDIDRAAATKALNASIMRCGDNPVTSCPISDAIDFVMGGKNCLTYRYIMFTALLAKAVDEDVDILSLQAGDKSAGAYDARSLAAKVVYPIQRDLLGNVLDGSNSDPLVNKPARFMRLRPSNPAAGGDPKRALLMLCESLPTITTSRDAMTCVDYIVSHLMRLKSERDSQRTAFDSSSKDVDAISVRRFMSDLLDQGFGGASLVLVATALHRLRFSGDSYEVRPHPVNQSGSSSHQFSDLDVLMGGKPLIGTELKDKPFSASDVSHAAATAHAAGAKSLLFVAGRQSTFASQPPTYFTEARSRYARLGMYVGVTSIDDFMDMTLSMTPDLVASDVLSDIRDTSERIGALEAQIWVYRRLSEVFGH